jgi:hypothetical protein
MVGARGKFFWIIVMFAASCGSSQKDAAVPKGPPVVEEGKKWGGWRWRGRREDCFFLHKNACFPSLELACKDAGCSKKTCTYDGKAPPHVTCKK